MVCAGGKAEEHKQHQEVLEDRSEDFRSNLIFKGKRDEISRLQPKAAQKLKIGHRIQCALHISKMNKKLKRAWNGARELQQK